MYRRSSILLIIFLLACPISVFSELSTPSLPARALQWQASQTLPLVVDPAFGEGGGKGGGEKRKLVYNQDTKELEYVPGELLVKFRSGVSRHLARATHRYFGSRTIKRFRRIDVDHIKIPEGWSVEEAISVYRLDPDVEYAEPNYIRRAFLMPNDPDFGKLWGLHNTGQEVNGTRGTEDADIDAPEAWDIQTGSSSVVIALIDTGADWDHEDLSENIWNNSAEIPDNGIDDDENRYVDDIRGWDFVKPDNDPDDDNAPDYHGTHVSGIISAKGNNNVGITGVCWSASIMPLKMLDANGYGSVAHEIEAIIYAIDNGAKIINLSLGGSGSSSGEYAAIESARDGGLLFVAAAGNEGGGNQESGWDNDVAGQEIYPAGYDLDNIISVAAADYNDNLALWSNYGPRSIDVAAPGADIYSTKAGGSYQYLYQYLSGSSMAAPHVSGLAALIWSADDSLTYHQVKDRILNGVDMIPSMNGKVLMSGRINANNSIRTPPHEPAQPSNLAAGAVSNNQIDLTWKDNSSDESGFKIERKTGSEGTYSQIATVGADVESYSNTGLSEVTTYYYRVSAFNSAGNSSYSSEAGATTYPIPPSNLLATTVSISQIDLIWTDNSSGEIGFRIERKTGSGGTYSQIATVEEDVTTYSDTELSGATTYYYRVSAYSDFGNSSYSNEASDTTFFSSSDSDSRCFLATAVYGSEDHRYVKILRSLRAFILYAGPFEKSVVCLLFLFLTCSVCYHRFLKKIGRHSD